MTEDEGFSFRFAFTPASEYLRPRRPELKPLPAWLRAPVEAVLHDFQQPTPVELSVGCYPDEECENMSIVVFTEPDGFGFGIGVVANEPEVSRLVLLADRMQEHFSELVEAWGQARPRCPRHTHPLAPAQREGAAWWACPADKTPVAPIGALKTS